MRNWSELPPSWYSRVGDSGPHPTFWRAAKNPLSYRGEGVPLMLDEQGESGGVGFPQATQKAVVPRRPPQFVQYFTKAPVHLECLFLRRRRAWTKHKITNAHSKRSLRLKVMHNLER